MSTENFNMVQLKDILLQMMETEMGGEKIYEAALKCVQNEDLEEEWEKYLEQTLQHQQVVKEICNSLGLDHQSTSPNRSVVKHVGESLVKAIEMAKEKCDADSAELIACECIVLAETKDHANWELIGMAVKGADKKTAAILSEAYKAVEKEEDHHLYHTKGWHREMAVKALGMAAVLPPPEEVRDVETAIGASRAEHQRKTML